MTSSEFDNYYLDINGIRTHYLEAGREHDETVLLLHSGEFGAAAEFSWGPVIGGLAERYHVLAPDMIGYGHTEKLFNFEDQFDFRVTHIGEFLQTKCIDTVHVIGNSLGGGDILSVASERAPSEWPIETVVSISGGGGPPDQFEDMLDEFDGSREAMEDILKTHFKDEWWSSDYLNRRVEMCRLAGQWQNVAALGLQAPFEQESTSRRSNRYDRIDVPTLVIAGESDPLKSVDTMRSVYKSVAENNPKARFEVIADVCHCAQIERQERTLELLFEFLED